MAARQQRPDNRKRTAQRCLAVLTLVAAAAAASAQEPVADTKFSVNRGFFDTPFPVTIATSTTGATIRYTTDGSWPSPTQGQIYSAPIMITTTTMPRAMAYKSGMAPTDVDTQTYIFLAGVLRQPRNIAGWPNNTYSAGGSATAVHDYEMDPAIVDAPAYRDDMIDAMKAIPTLSIVMDKADFWAAYDGEDVVRRASVELIHPYDPSRDEHVFCGVESHSHKRLKRSMRLHFSSQYGASKFESNIFRDALLSGNTATGELDHIILRAGNNRSWARIWNDGRACYTRDQWYRDALIELSGKGSRGMFAHLYVNGLYWGLYNPIERPDAWFTSAYFGGNKDDWYSASHGGSHGGDPTRWNYLSGTLKNRDMSLAANYRELQEHLDLETFCDYLIVTWMTGMTDWPVNNWWGGNRNNPPGPFYYFGWDCEWSWDTTSGSNLGAWVHPDFRQSKSGGATIAALWHAARKNADFLMLFADRAYRACFDDGPLTDANARARWARLNNHVRDAVVGESARWGDAMEANGHATRTRDGDWLREYNRLDALMATNVARFLTALRTEGFYPVINPPTFWDDSREVRVRRLTAPAGFRLGIRNPNSSGLILYTLDGTDPRDPGGAVSAHTIDAGISAASVPIHATTLVKARIKSASTWSALHEMILFVEQDLTPLKITEIMYHPLPAVLEEGRDVVRITGDLGGDDAGHARVEFGAALPAVLTGGDRLVLSGAAVAANNGTFAIDHVEWNDTIRLNNVILKKPLASESVSPATADFLYDGDRFEFVELKNTSTTRTLNLSGVTFTKGIRYTFPDGAQLAPRGFAVLTSSRADFARRYADVATSGSCLGSLENAGERIEAAFSSGERFDVSEIVPEAGGGGRLRFASLPQGLKPGDRVEVQLAARTRNNGMHRIALIMGNDVYVSSATLQSDPGGAQGLFYRTLTSVDYGTTAPWPAQADGGGHSLAPTRRNPRGDQDAAVVWRASTAPGGSPGADVPEPPSTGAKPHWRSYR